MQPKPKTQREREKITGGVFLLAAFSFIAAFILDFNFVTPYTSVQEDLSYLNEHPDRQSTSASAWLATGSLTLLALPFYLSVSRRKLTWLAYLNGLLLLATGAGFIMMGKTGLNMHHLVLEMAPEIRGGLTESERLTVLELFNEEQRFRRIGSFGMGCFALGLGLSAFRLKHFPGLAAVLLLVGGPMLAFFNVHDPEHIGKTVAVAGILSGIMIYSARLITRGLNRRVETDANQSHDPAAGPAPVQETGREQKS